MSRSLLLTLLLVSSALMLVGCKKDDPRRHYETEGKFSFVPPEGWTMLNLPNPDPALGVKSYASCRELKELGDGQSCGVMHVQERMHTGTLDEFVKLFKKNTIFSQMDVRQAPFMTEIGLEGRRLEAEAPGLRLTMYVFPRESSKVHILCSGGASGKTREQYDPIFAASMKTFRFD